MLVLSRKNNESIHFPELAISVKILQIKNSSVRIGIDAPVEISVVRGEIDECIRTLSEFAKQSEHVWRNKINEISVGIALATKLLECGEVESASEKLKVILDSISAQKNTLPTRKKNKLTALLVEDSDNEREMLAGFLKLCGFDVETASDGLEAISHLEQDVNAKPDVILMDINLPNLCGQETIRQIRNNPDFDSVAIFAVSGESEEQSGLSLTQNRIGHWFQKPVQPDLLVSTISKHVNGTKLCPNTNPESKQDNL